ncbi:MAG TPA: hypothetical protein VEP67_13090 [Thiobacillaceae bacterium]|nr:hypothetical protein [Thiobacillaceae bacterium]
MSFRFFRIAVLLGILVFAVGFTLGESYLVRSWRAPLQVSIYPINGDGSAASAAYIGRLRSADFADINTFLQGQARRYGVKLDPALTLALEPPLDDIPPPPPHDRSVPKIMLWSLKLRWWVYRHSTSVLPQLARIRIYVLYHEADEDMHLDHSLGLQKGLVGVVHAFASDRQRAQNNVVITHELLHTLGATDKYDPLTSLPINPEGYAEPDQLPLYPQHQAEIMAGRIPISAQRAVMPSSLAACVIGPATAYEINFGGAAANQFDARK